MPAEALTVAPRYRPSVFCVLGFRNDRVVAHRSGEWRGGHELDQYRDLALAVQGSAQSADEKSVLIHDAGVEQHVTTLAWRV